VNAFVPDYDVFELIDADTRRWERMVTRAAKIGRIGHVAKNAFAQAVARDHASNNSDLIATGRLGEPPMCVAWAPTRLLCQRIMRHWRRPIWVTSFDYRWSFFQLVSPYQQQFFVVCDPGRRDAAER
jgi:hypothetical protein